MLVVQKAQTTAHSQHALTPAPNHASHDDSTRRHQQARRKHQRPCPSFALLCLAGFLLRNLTAVEGEMTISTVCRKRLHSLALMSGLPQNRKLPTQPLSSSSGLRVRPRHCGTRAIGAKRLLRFWVALRLCLCGPGTGRGLFWIPLQRSRAELTWHLTLPHLPLPALLHCCKWQLSDSLRRLRSRPEGRRIRNNLTHNHPCSFCICARFPADWPRVLSASWTLRLCCDWMPPAVNH